MAAVEEEEVFDEEFAEEEVPVGDAAAGAAGAEQGGTDEDLEAMKRKLKEMEDEAARLRTLQGAGASGDVSMTAGGGEAANKEEVDSRSVYVGNVDYSVTPEELQQHFNSCGTVNRVTILTDKVGNPKGYAYVEFLEVDAVNNALLLDNTELRGRNIKVVQKRTNVPGLKVRGRGRGGRGRGGHGAYGMPFGAMPFMPMMPMMPYGGRGRGGYAPRGGAPGRGRGRGFAPY